MVRRIQFRPVKSSFQSQLLADVKVIRISISVIVQADKTTNLYRMSVADYSKLLNDNITAKHKKTSADTVSDINNEAKTIAREPQLDSRIERFSDKNAFVTIKDHKKNFPNNLMCRLINPAKSQIGIVGKQILEKIDNTIRSQSNFNQWRNTSSVISWFNSIPNKSECKFLKFDIVDFYPNISEDILRAAITFANPMSTLKNETFTLSCTQENHFCLAQMASG